MILLNLFHTTFCVLSPSQHHGFKPKPFIKRVNFAFPVMELLGCSPPVLSEWPHKKNLRWVSTLNDLWQVSAMQYERTLSSFLVKTNVQCKIHFHSNLMLKLQVMLSQLRRPGAFFFSSYSTGCFVDREYISSLHFHGQRCNA